MAFKYTHALSTNKKMEKRETFFVVYIFTEVQLQKPPVLKIDCMLMSDLQNRQ